MFRFHQCDVHQGDLTHHVFQLVLTRVQRLPDALGQQDLVLQPLLAEGHSATGDDHHLSTLILQHGHLVQSGRFGHSEKMVD